MSTGKGTQHNSCIIGVNHPWIKLKDFANSRGKYIGKLEGIKGGWHIDPIRVAFSSLYSFFG